MFPTSGLGIKTTVAEITGIILTNETMEHKAARRQMKRAIYENVLPQKISFGETVSLMSEYYPL